MAGEQAEKDGTWPGWHPGSDVGVERAMPRFMSPSLEPGPGLVQKRQLLGRRFAPQDGIAVRTTPKALDEGLVPQGRGGTPHQPAPHTADLPVWSAPQVR